MRQKIVSVPPLQATTDEREEEKPLEKSSYLESRSIRKLNLNEDHYCTQCL